MKYLRPDWATRHLFNPAVMLATRLGLSMRGSRVIAVRGRKTGAIRTNPVNLLEHEGARYLVAPRGNTEWVRNVRAANGEAELRLGRRKERVRLHELSDEVKPALLREYLKRWKMETGKFFGLADDASDEDLRRVAPDHPVFRVEVM